MTLSAWVQVALMVGACLAFYHYGYAIGVKHTEERWRDAVGRAGHQ